ncbi:MAG TPA: HepT-like ribonuclease domain-containing protein [Flavobacterium sp.]|nr:HepT-like ribonuclease domain-containing protein [Flavobacterium sp.]
MISLEQKKLLSDILESISSIDEHLEGKKSFEEYIQNKTKRRAVERELEIIGEAISKLLKIQPEIKISYARLIVDLRNKVIHAYDSVDDILIWKIVMKDIPVLEAEVRNLLK